MSTYHALVPSPIITGTLTKKGFEVRYRVSNPTLELRYQAMEYYL